MKRIGRQPVEVNIDSPKDGYVPIFEEQTRLWKTVPTSSFTSATSSFSISASYAVSSSYPIAVTGSTLYTTIVTPREYISPFGNIAFGDKAGYENPFSFNSIFLGTEAGYSSSNAYYSNFIGSKAGFAVSYSYFSNYIGYEAGLEAKNSEFTNFLGRNAGHRTTNSDYATFIGNSAGESSYDAYSSNFIGQRAGYFATGSYYSNFIGYQAGQRVKSASYSTLIGYNAGSRVSGEGISQNNIIIGTNVTLEEGRSDSINIGALIFATGAYSTTSGNPFSGSVNGFVGINQPVPIYELDVSGSGRYTNDLSITGSVLFNGGASIVPSGPNIDVVAGPDGWAELASNDGDQYVWVDNLAAYIGTNWTSGSKSWTFDRNGSIYAPGDINIPSYSQLYGTSSWSISALTASSADNFTVRGTLTAQTIVVQVITSSTELVTGSLTVSGSLNALSGLTGSVFGTSSFANSASYAINAGTASNILGGSATYVPFFKTNTTLATSSIYQISNSYTQTSVAINETNITSANPEALYVFQVHPTSINVLTGKGNLNNYLQNNIQNTNQGVSASSDIVATANNGNEDVNYIDMGINSQNYSQGFIGGANDAYVYAIANNLHIGNANDNGTHVGFFVGGTDVEAYNKLQLNPDNQHKMSGSLSISGSLTVNNGITGSLDGTASWARNAVSAAYAANVPATASYALQALSSSYAVSASNALTASYALNAQGSGFPFTGSAIISGSLIVTGSVRASLGFTGSLQGTASWASNAVTASYVLNAVSASFSTSASQAISASYVLNAVSASFASTASSVNQLNQNVTISGSLTVTGSSGTTLFVSNADTLTFTGSIFISGSITSTGSINVTSVTSSLFGTASWANNSISASFATSASQAQNAVSASYVLSAISASFATSASQAQNAVSASYVLNSVSSSFATSASQAQNSVTASYVLNAVSSSFATSASQAQNAVTASYVLNAVSTSFASTSSLPLQGIVTASAVGSTITFTKGDNTTFNVGISTSTAQTASYVSSSNVDGPYGKNSILSASFAYTASYVPNGITNDQTASLSVLSSSFATTASFVQNAQTASYTLTASYALNSGLLNNTASSVFATTGSNVFRGNQIVTGSVFVSGSNTLIGNTILSGSVDISGSTTITGTTTFRNASTTITGSLLITGSTTQVGSNTLLGNTTLTGSIIISGALSTINPTIKVYGDIQQYGYHRFDPVTTNIDQTVSASYIYVSGSTNDLYFSQNGNGYSNTTRLRWLEGNLYTGLLNGGIITSQSSTAYQISSGSGIIVNLNASFTDNLYPTIKYINWPNLSASIAPLSASYDQSFVSVDSNAQIFAQGIPFNDGQYNTQIPIGVVIHQNRSTINGVQTFASLAYGWKQRSSDFIRAFGPLKLSGLDLYTSSSRGLTIGSGTAWSDGRNYTVDPNNPSYITDTGTAVSKIFRYYQSGSSWVYDTNGGAGYTTIDPTQYSNNGVLTSVGSGNWSIQRAYWFPNSATKAIYVYYGNARYTTQADAIANLSIEPFVEAPNTAAQAVYVGAVIINGTGVFTNANDYKIIPAGLFRSIGGTGGGGSAVTTTLSGLSDVSISAPTDGQALVYNTTALKWQNSSNISASISGNAATATSASFATTASYVLNAVSSSYSISSSNAQTASYALNAVSSSYAISSSNAITASYVLNSVSSSFSLTASSADNFTVRGTLTAQTIVVQTITSSTDFVTGSTRFGTSQSNTHQFTGSVSITGSLSVTGTGITSSLFGTSSWSNNSISSSFASTASYVLNAVSASFATSASQAQNSSTASYVLNAVTASYVLNAISASYVLNAVSASFAASASQSQTASYVLNAVSSSYAINSTNAQTASYVLNAVSSSFASQSQNATSASYVLNAVSASFATLASQAQNANTASYVLNAVSSSFSTFASQSQNATTASYVLNAVSSSFAVSSSQSQNAISASYVLNAVSSSVSSTASFVNTLNQNVLITGSLTIGQTSVGASENTLIVGPAPTGGAGEGGQILLTATGGAYTSASMIDTYQNLFRVLRGTNAGSDAEFFRINLHTGQLTVNKYTGSGVFPGTAVANLSVDASGNIITVATGTVTSASYALSASFSTSASQAQNSATASYVLNAVTASYVLNAVTASYVLNSVSASFATSASQAQNAVSASYVLNSVSSSFASTSSLPLRGLITASAAGSTITFTKGDNSTFNVTVTVGNSATASYVASSDVDGPLGKNTILSSSYAVTSSYANNFTVASQLTIDSTLTDYATVASSIVGSNNLFTQATGSYTSAFFKYTVSTGSNSRAGEVVAVWNGASVQYYDNSTVDVGNTAAVTSSVSVVAGDVQFNVQTNTSGWRIKSLATFM